MGCCRARRRRSGPRAPSGTTFSTRSTTEYARKLERVPAPARLRLQVTEVRCGHVHARRHLLHDGHAEGAELPGLVGVVAEERDARHAERVQHLRGGDVAALVRAVAEREVRLVRVDTGVLQCIRIELRVEPDAATFLPQVEEIAAGRGDALDRLAQLRPAVAPLAPEDVSGKALAVGADQRDTIVVGGMGGGAIAEREREVLAVVDEPV